MKPSRCVRCGYCCSQGPCPFGDIDLGSGSTACIYLKKEQEGYACSKLQEIMKHPDSWFSPAFGAGCCSPLNSMRRAMLNPDPMK